MAGGGAIAVGLGVVRQDRLFAVAFLSAIIFLIISRRRGAKAQEWRALLWAMHAPEGLMDAQMTESAISAQLAVIAAGDVTLLEGAGRRLSSTEGDPWRGALACERLDGAVELAVITLASGSRRKAAALVAMVALGVVVSAVLPLAQAVSLAMSWVVAGVATVLTRRNERRLMLELVCEKATTPVAGVPVTTSELEVIDVLVAVAGSNRRILRRASSVASLRVCPRGHRARRRLAAAEHMLSSASGAT